MRYSFRAVIWEDHASAKALLGQGLHSQNMPELSGLISPRVASLGGYRKAGQKTHLCKLWVLREEGCFLAHFLSLRRLLPALCVTQTALLAVRRRVTPNTQCSSSSAVRPSTAQQEPPCCRRKMSWRGSVLPALCPRDKEQLSHRSWPCCWRCLATTPNPSSLLSPQVHCSILSKDVSPPYAPAYPKHYILAYRHTARHWATHLPLLPAEGVILRQKPKSLPVLLVTTSAPNSSWV